MAQANRPLSPHLQIYRWYLTMAMSIIIDQLFESTLYGAIVGLIYKPAAHAVRRPATV